MANKDALREFQLRLAQRLQAVRERPRETGWLAVETAGVGLLFPLHQAGEIHAMRALMPVPHAAPWLRGIANLRGELHAVLDLATFLGLRPLGPAAGPLVALNTSLRTNCALCVDRLVGLRDSTQLQACQDDPEPTDRPAFAGGRWRDEQQRIWQVLDLNALATDASFLDVAARQAS